MYNKTEFQQKSKNHFSSQSVTPVKDDEASAGVCKSRGAAIICAGSLERV